MSDVTPTPEQIETARGLLAPYFATDGEDDNAEMVEALLTTIAHALAAEVAREREECAKVADNLHGTFDGWPYDDGAGSQGWDRACDRIEDAIRKRGK